MSAPNPTAIVGRKLQSLDGLRAVAILLVFFHHMQQHIPAVNLPVRVMKMYVAQGWMGVDLFFVLSGFLITGILLDTREAGNFFTGFYARRVLRIFPLYYLVLTVVIIAGIQLHNPEVTATLPLPGDGLCGLPFGRTLGQGQPGDPWAAVASSLIVGAFLVSADTGADSEENLIKC